MCEGSDRGVDRRTAADRTKTIDLHRRLDPGAPKGAVKLIGRAGGALGGFGVNEFQFADAISRSPFLRERPFEADAELLQGGGVGAENELGIAHLEVAHDWEENVGRQIPGNARQKIGECLVRGRAKSGRQLGLLSIVSDVDDCGAPDRFHRDHRYLRLGRNFNRLYPDDGNIKAHILIRLRRFNDNSFATGQGSAALNCLIRSFESFNGEDRPVFHDDRLSDVERSDLACNFPAEGNVLLLPARKLFPGDESRSRQELFHEHGRGQQGDPDFVQLQRNCTEN